MSFGRHAYRHALKPTAAPTFDHLWISDDLLAATFRRFANGQRRHGSCVPGPLEARRRLAKRRNTALAGLGAVSAEDIACLFGRNGREHMKWTDHPWQRASLETQGTSNKDISPIQSVANHYEDSRSYSLATTEASLPFYDHNPEPIDTSISHDPQPTSYKPTAASRAELLAEFLEQSDWGLEDARDFARQLGIDLQREPKYSRQIFDNLLPRSTTDLKQVIQFLDDPFLNTRGSGNYLTAVSLFVQTKTKRSNRIAVLNSLCRALELGLVATDELCHIVKALPNIIVERNQALGTWDQKTLLKHFRAMWKAIGRCTILGYHDLDKELVDVWLTELVNLRSFRFAEEFVLATHDASSDSRWPTALVMAQLHESETTLGLTTVHHMLSQLDADCGARCIVEVTESLAMPDTQIQSRYQVLECWRHCLSDLSNVPALANSQVWLDLPFAYNENIAETAQAPPILPVQQQIVLRLWALRALSWSPGPMYRHIPRPTDKPIYFLLGLYEMSTERTDGSFLSDLMRGIQTLNLPHSNLLLLAVSIKMKKNITKNARETLEKLETSQVSLTDVWADPAAYNGIRALFHGTFEQMFRRLDITSSESAEECLHLARVGDSKSIWSVLRILRNHTPFKLCLNKAWVPLPHPDEMALVRYHAGPRNSQSPDPHAAVDFVHRLAVAISCSHNLTPSRSFHLIHLLYDYLRRHGGPVYPSLVQAMYHAGVVRYRREGRRVSPTQYEYILWIVSKFEGHEVARQLSAPAQIGLGKPGHQDEF
ncbi:uncharacterized protein N7458_002173 [Penicillium daleae]|uniref:Uncharacterized protein n=1 Tax=Penicillium daleae TaxID=63821 RepID=A0AAD6CC98_9EURO|nr:uncharacterized protein N7458_002173 [Penicillium daleae]KAJ5460621.1 hypothetical protein N7458_002173 [Penicillium daleae]